MAYKMTSSDASVVSNLRYEHKEAVAAYSDATLARCWRDFSNSEDYYDPERAGKFLEWAKDYHEEDNA